MSDTLIDLEGPYSKLYRKGYLRLNDADGRRRVDLFNSDTDRTTISYARYLVSIREGRLLSEDEEVDHRDNDLTNDHIDNLQILSAIEHRKKTSDNRIKRRQYLSFVCPVCGESFQRDRWKLSPNTKEPKCSRKCAFEALRK